jgi:hypothetical protein
MFTPAQTPFLRGTRLPYLPSAAAALIRFDGSSSATPAPARIVASAFSFSALVDMALFIASPSLTTPHNEVARG